METYTGFSGAEIGLYQDNVLLGDIRAISWSDRRSIVLVGSLDREEFRNDGTAVIKVTYLDEYGTLIERLLDGFKFSNYGEYDVYEPLEFTFDRVSDGS
jgi:hypothetical protein